MVSVSDVRELLESTVDDPHLVLEGGQLVVRDGASVADNPTGLVVTTAQELRKTHGLEGDVTEDKLTRVAAILDDQVTKLGA